MTLISGNRPVGASTSEIDGPPLHRTLDTGLPRRDFILLPLLVIATVLVYALICEGGARYFYQAQEGDACVVPDNWIGFRFKPNCTAPMKTPEGPWTTNAYNDCGYRTRESCKLKPPGTVRVALLGSSVAQGLYVPYDDTYAGRTASVLSGVLRRPVELQNMGRPGTSPISTFHQLNEALALKPQFLVMAIDSFDVEHMDPTQMPHRYDPIPPAKKSRVRAVDPMVFLRTSAKESRAAEVAEHFMFQDSDRFVQYYLNFGDHADYLRKPLAPVWERRLEALDALLGEMQQKCQAAGVKFVLLKLPSMAQVALVKMPVPPRGVDPYQLDDRLQEIASRHDIGFIDPLGAFKAGPPPAKLFYIVDTHLNAEGAKLVSQVLAADLLKYQHASSGASDNAQIAASASQQLQTSNRTAVP